MELKICGVRQMEIIPVLKNIGAQYVGMIMVPSSKRFVDEKLSDDLYQAIQDFGMRPVAVLQNPSQQKAEKIARRYPKAILQFHGTEPNDFIEQFPEVWKTVIPSKTDFEFAQSDYDKISQHAVLMLDSAKRGKVLNWKALERPSRKFILAGGIQALNINLAIDTMQPDILDLSSGVEISDGVKCPEKLAQLSAQIKSPKLTTTETNLS